jgi:hypothetical protein
VIENHLSIEEASFFFLLEVRSADLRNLFPPNSNATHAAITTHTPLSSTMASAGFVPSFARRSVSSLGNNPIRWGILSAGRVASDYAQAIRAAENAEVSCFVNITNGCLG